MTRQERAQAKRERRALRPDASAYARRNATSAGAATRAGYVRRTASAGRREVASALRALMAAVLGRGGQRVRS